MNVRIKSEGALDEIEQTIVRFETLERLLQSPVELVATSLPSPRVDEAAVARLEKLDSAPVQRLNALRARVALLARAQLRERDIEPTTDNVEDLLVQLIARANVPARVQKPKRPSRSRIAIVPIAAIPVVAFVEAINGESGQVIGATMGVLCITSILAYLLSRGPPN